MKDIYLHPEPVTQVSRVTPMTGGELIRALGAYYATTHSLNTAVNNWRRVRGSKNWVAAAQELLDALDSSKVKDPGERP